MPESTGGKTGDDRRVGSVLLVQMKLANLKRAKSAELGAHTVAQLRALCAQRGLRKAGAKAELVARLCDALCADAP